MRRIFALGFIVAGSVAAFALLGALRAQPGVDEAACAAQPTRRCVLSMALAAAQSERDERLHFGAMARVVEAQIAIGALAEARATMDIVHDPDDPTGGAETALYLLVRAGRIDEAMRAADTLLPGRALPPTLWIQVAEAHALAGRTAEAQAALAHLGPDTSAADQASGLAAIGRAADALAAVGRIADPGERRDALMRIASTHARAGRRAAAAAAARAIDNTLLRTQRLQTVAEQLGDPELAAEAVATARALRGTMFQDTTAAGTALTLAQTQAAAGRADDALTTARAITRRSYRALALLAVAQATRDPMVNAEALQAIADLPEGIDRDDALRSAALAALATGHPDDARALARRIGDARMRDSAFGMLGVELARTHRFGDAVALASAIDWQFTRAQALAEIAPLLPQ